MKKLFILMLLAFLIFFPACDDSSNSSDEADAETEEAVNAIAGEAILISYMGMIQEVTYSPPVDGVSRGITRLITVESTPITGYDGVTISGSYDFTTTEEFTADLDILFTNYTGVATINGTVNIDIDGDYGIPSFSITTSSQQLEAIYNGSTYTMIFDFTITITETTVSATGNIECNGSTIDFSYTENLST